MLRLIKKKRPVGSARQQLSVELLEQRRMLNADRIGLYSQDSSVFKLKDSFAGGSADAYVRFGPQSNTWVSLSGDWNGDGRDSIGLYQPELALFHLKNDLTPGQADEFFSFGPQASGWIPLAGDWDGDGVDTIGLYDADTSIFHLKNRLEPGASDEYFSFGPAGREWAPVVGDWNGDGIDSIGLYDSDMSTFHLKDSFEAGASNYYFRFGPENSTWTPLSGDWDGDGLDTIGLFDPQESLFHLKDNLGSGFSDHLFGFGPSGNVGWIPVVGDWDGVNQPPLAIDDIFSTSADTAKFSGNLLHHNGMGADSDLDSDNDLEIAMINGQSFFGNATFALAMGAFLHVSSDGSFVFEPNGQSSELSVNESSTASFSYTLTDGIASSSANVDVHVYGAYKDFVPHIAPSVDWDGTLDWPSRSVPDDPERTSYKPVAHFAIPPFQDLTNDLTIPVVAFAKGGIEKVSFYVEGTTIDVGAPIVVTEYSGKPFEAFVVRLDASEFPSRSGPMEVYATVHPIDPGAQERVIALPLFANVGDALPSAKIYVDAINGDDANLGGITDPVRSINRARNVLRAGGQVDGATILLRDGEYAYGTGLSGNVNNERWLTIKADAGHTPVITEGGSSTGLRIRRVKIDGISIDDKRATTFRDSQFVDSVLWLNDVTYSGPGREIAGSKVANGFDYYYATDVNATDARDGIVGADLARNVYISDISSDALTGSVVVGAYVDVIDNSGTSFHPDVWQYSVGNHENLLLYGVATTNRTDAAGIFLNDFTVPAKDVAIVNNLIITPDGRRSQIHDVDISHLYFSGNTLAGGFVIRQSTIESKLEFMEVTGNVFSDLVGVVDSARHGENENDWESNFFVNSAQIQGVDYASGSPDWDSDLMPTKDGNLQMDTSSFSLLDLSGANRASDFGYFGAFEAEQ